MNKNLSNRILTSIFLLVIFLFCLFTQKILWTFLLITAAILSFFEFNNLVKKKFKKNQNNILLFNIFCVNKQNKKITNKIIDVKILFKRFLFTKYFQNFFLFF